MHARLAHRVLREARIQAFKRPQLGPPGIGFRGGVVLEEQDNRLRHQRHGAPYDSFDPDAEYHHRVHGEFLYGGPVCRHFGHFMAEMVHRIVPSILLHGGLPFIFVTLAAKGDGVASLEMIPGYAQDVLRLLGIQENTFLLIDKNSIVDHLFVVQQGSHLGGPPEPGYLDDLREYIEPRLDAIHEGEKRPKKVYVSRKGMGGGFFLGEGYLE